MGFHPTQECTMEKAVEHLYDWQHGGNSFYCYLYAIIQKADDENLRKLYLGFPVHVNTWQLWNITPSQDEFFDKYLPKDFKK